MLGAPWAKPTQVLCSPGWLPFFDRTCKLDSAKAQLACGHTANQGTFPHARLGVDVPCSVAAEYCDGVCEARALELARLREDVRPQGVAGREDTESAHGVHRHALRGEDPESQWKARERGSATCKAGLRNLTIARKAGPDPNWPPRWIG